MQAPGSCRWMEVLLHIAGMSPGRCEKLDSFCLLKLLVHSLVADKFLGYLHPTTWEGLSSHWGKKSCVENQCDTEQGFGEDGGKSCL